MITFSVIVSTLNRSASLARLLTALRCQRHAPHEVIVVVGPCTDDTQQVLTKYRDYITIMHCETANISAARNLGASIAAGDILAFIDDDAVPEFDWLSELLTAPLGPPRWPLIKNVAGCRPNW